MGSDILTVVEDRERLSVELGRMKEELRAAQREVTRGTTLAAESKRIERERDKAAEKFSEQARKNAELQEQISTLEAELRSRADQIKSLSEDLANNQDQSVALREAQEDVDGCAAIIDSQQDKIAAQEKEIVRLREHEKQTHQLLAALDKARELT
jgi:chromosome segregation ATPase